MYEIKKLIEYRAVILTLIKHNFKNFAKKIKTHLAKKILQNNKNNNNIKSQKTQKIKI